MNNPQKELIDFIEDQYNVPVTVENGGKHAKLRWTYDDRNYTYAVTRNRTQPPRAYANSVADIRRMMGRAAEPPARPHKTMDELMAEVRGRAIEDITPDSNSHPAPRVDTPSEETYVPPLESEPEVSTHKPQPQPAPTPTPTRPTRIWQVTVNCYQAHASRNVVSMLFPPEIMDTAFSFRVEKLDDEHWRLRPGGVRTFRPYYGPAARLTFVDDCKPFGRMHVEAVEVDGEILIYVPLNTRPKVQTDRRLRKKARPATPAEEFFSDEHGGQVEWSEAVRRQQERETEERETQQLRDQQAQMRDRMLEDALNDRIIQTTSLEDEMRQILRKIRAVEDTTPYRLDFQTRAGGDRRWIWQAPVIE